MSEVDNESVVKELIRNVLETRFETFTQANIEDAKNRIIDIVGCAIGGAYAPGNSILLDLVRDWGGKEEATILVHGDMVPVHNAAMVNCVMCRSFDYEVCGPYPAEPLFSRITGRFSGHIPGTTDCTALTIAEQKKASGRELISAMILGGDLSARIANTEDFAFEHSFDYTGTVNAFGAAAVAGRLYGITERQMLNAFGILVNLIAGSFQNIWDGVQTFKLCQGTSARNAIFSVELASKGFTGIKDPFFSPHGYFYQYCKGFHPEFLAMELGNTFYTRGKHKMYPSCYGNHTALECGHEIISRHDIDDRDIAEVILVVPRDSEEGFLNQPFQLDDSQQKALFNLPYGVANVLLRKDTRLEHYTEEFIKDPRVIELAQKVKLVPSKLKKTGTKKAPTELKVRMKDGREFTAQVAKPRDFVGNGVTRKDIEDKYWHNVDFCKTVSQEKAEEVLNMLLKLDEVDDVSKIVSLLVVKS